MDFHKLYFDIFGWKTICKNQGVVIHYSWLLIIWTVIEPTHQQGIFSLWMEHSPWVLGTIWSVLKIHSTCPQKHLGYKGWWITKRPYYKVDMLGAVQTTKTLAQKDLESGDQRGPGNQLIQSPSLTEEEIGNWRSQSYLPIICAEPGTCLLIQWWVLFCFVLCILPHSKWEVCGNLKTDDVPSV
jgi:hypothetical protein